MCGEEVCALLSKSCLQRHLLCPPVESDEGLQQVNSSSVHLYVHRTCIESSPLSSDDSPGPGQLIENPQSKELNLYKPRATLQKVEKQSKQSECLL